MMMRGASRNAPGSVIIRLPMASIEDVEDPMLSRGKHDVVRRLLTEP